MICNTCVYNLNCTKERMNAADETDQCEKHADAYFDTILNELIHKPLPRSPLNDPFQFEANYLPPFFFIINHIHDNIISARNKVMSLKIPEIDYLYLDQLLKQMEKQLSTLYKIFNYKKK